MKPMDIDIGLIVIIQEELDQLFKVFEISEENRVYSINNTFAYYKFTMTTATRPVTIVVSCINGKSGNIESALCTTYFFRNWTPKIMCLIGIAAGIEGKVDIGDVIVPYKILDISVKMYEDNGFRNRLVAYTRKEIINKMIKIKFRQNGFNFKIKDGSLGTDNTLIRDRRFFTEFLSCADEECKGAEMEAAGFVRACELENVPWIVMRGVSDYGTNKTDDYQSQAAYNVCVALKHLLSHCIDINKVSTAKEKIVNNYMEDYFEHELDVHYSNSNWEQVCKINSVISRYLFLTGQYRLRILLGEKTLRAANEGKLTEHICRILIDDLGWTNFLIYLETNSSNYKSEALKRIKEGIKQAESINDFYSLSKGHRHLASISRHEHKLQKAQLELNKAEEFLHSIHDIKKKRELRSALLLSKSKLYYEKAMTEKQGNIHLNQSIELACQAERDYMEQGDRERLVKAYRLLYKAYLKDGREDMARDYLSKEEELVKQIGRVVD